MSHHRPSRALQRQTIDKASAKERGEKSINGSADGETDIFVAARMFHSGNRSVLTSSSHPTSIWLEVFMGRSPNIGRAGEDSVKPSIPSTVIKSDWATSNFYKPYFYGATAACAAGDLCPSLHRVSP